MLDADTGEFANFECAGYVGHYPIGTPFNHRTPMASREFADPAGVIWTVWAVVPQDMSSALKRLTGGAGERRTPWLVFQSATGEKRRVTPVPSGWEEYDDTELMRMWEAAVRVPPAPARRSWDRG